MAYREDKDLFFLSECTSDELEPLVLCLTQDKNGKKRLTEELTKKEKYKAYYPLHYVYWKEIAEEIQRFGGDTIFNYIKGKKGVLYKEILIDVCKKLKVNFNKESETQIIESNLLMKILTDSIEKLPENELKQLAIDLGVKNAKNLAPNLIIPIMQQAFLAGGFMSYQLTAIIANAVVKAISGAGLAFGANAAVMKAMSILTGPIGVTLSSAWLIKGISGPAYRVTIPAIIHIACLRQIKNNSH